MKKLSLIVLAFIISFSALAEVHVYGLYMADVTIHEDGQQIGRAHV